jgi:hypothetical protein
VLGTWEVAIVETFIVCALLVAATGSCSSQALVSQETATLQVREVGGVKLRPAAVELLDAVERLCGKPVSVVFRNDLREGILGYSYTKEDGTPTMIIVSGSGQTEENVVHELYHLKMLAEGYPLFDFGHQAINALFPAPLGAPATEALLPGPRLYHPPSMPEFQALKRKLEEKWVPAVQRLLEIETESLPILWDCDFLLGPQGDKGEDTYVLCEINVSSVAPYPESAVPYVIDASVARVQTARQRRGLAL